MREVKRRKTLVNRRLTNGQRWIKVPERRGMEIWFPFICCAQSATVLAAGLCMIDCKSNTQQKVKDYRERNRERERGRERRGR